MVTARIQKVPADRVKFIGSKEVKKELGVEIKDKKNRVWYIAQWDLGAQLGFAAIDPIQNGTYPFKGKGAEIKYLWVNPNDRNRGFESALLQLIMTEWQCPLKATVLPAEKQFYEGFGFKQVFHYGQYPLMSTVEPVE